MTASVTGCSTWMRAFTSRNQNADRSASTRNSTVPRPWYFSCRPKATAAARMPTLSISPSPGASSTSFLIPPLHQAVPVAEVDHVLPVAQYLHLDVPRGGDVLLQVNPRIGERRPRLRAGHRDRLGLPPRLADDPQSSPAPAPRRLDQHRIPDPFCQPGRACPAGPVRMYQPARQHRESRAHCVIPGRELVPGRLEDVRAWPDEHDAGRLARPREPRVLRQEAVARMDRVRPRRDRGRDDPFHVEVTLRRALGPDPDRLAGQPGRHRIRVGVRDRQHGLDAQALAGAQDADGDLAAVGDQHPPQDH